MATARLNLGSNLPVPDPLRTRNRRLVGLLIPRPENWEGGTGRTHRQIECRAGRHLRRRIPWREAHASQMDRRLAHRGWSDTRRLQGVT